MSFYYLALDFMFETDSV